MYGLRSQLLLLEENVLPEQLSSHEDISHLTAIYQRYAPALFAYIHRHVGSLEDAEDLLLEAFLAALERPGFDLLDMKRQEAWLWNVARNKMVDHHRKRLRRQGVSLEIIPEDMHGQDPVTPEILLLRQEDYRHLYASIQHLPAIQQEIVRLRFSLGLRTSEIAVILQKSEGAVRTMLSRALKVLRTLYDNEKEA